MTMESTISNAKSRIGGIGFRLGWGVLRTCVGSEVDLQLHVSCMRYGVRGINTSILEALCPRTFMDDGVCT